MTPYTLLELIYKHYCEGNVEDTIIEINELISDIFKDPYKYIEKLSKELQEFSLQNQRCPLCSEKLEYNTYKESRGEHQGLECWEDMNSIQCPNNDCSFTEE